MGNLGALLIGVRAPDGFDALHAVDSSVASMAKWARTQTDETRVFVITDEHEAVTTERLTRAMELLLADHSLSKLVVYFAGHGLYKDFGEFWILSGATRWPQQAVNVRASVELAKRTGIEHVVFVSDACRTPAASLPTVDITGSVIFPSQQPVEPPSSIDRLYGSRVGRPAYEIRPAGRSAHVAPFSEVLAAALTGSPSVFVTEHDEEGPVVLAHGLQQHLSGALRAFLDDAGVGTGHDQRPDIEIASPPGTWLSRIPQGLEDSAESDRLEAGPFLLTPGDEARKKLSRALAHAEDVWERQGDPVEELPASPRDWPRDDQIVLTSTRTAISGVWHEGVELPFAWEQIREDGAFIAFDVPRWGFEAESYVVQLASGDLLPVVAGPSTHVHIDTDGASVRKLHYRRGSFRERGQDSADLVREAVEVASAAGLFRPNEEQVELIISAMRRRKDVDPSLALYTAYALFDRSERHELSEMRMILTSASGYDFFDLAMLEAMLHAEAHPSAQRPGFPLLSQGWPLLFGLTEPTSLQRDLEPLRRAGLWTSFRAEARDILIRGV